MSSHAPGKRENLHQASCVIAYLTTSTRSDGSSACEHVLTAFGIEMKVNICSTSSNVKCSGEEGRNVKLGADSLNRPSARTSGPPRANTTSSEPAQLLLGGIESCSDETESLTRNGDTLFRAFGARVGRSEATTSGLTVAVDSGAKLATGNGTRAKVLPVVNRV